MKLRSPFIAAVAAVLLYGCATQQSNSPTVDSTGVDELPFISPAGEASYHVLMAEIALERGEWTVGAAEYRQAAALSDDPDIAQRAARVAFDHGEIADAYASASRWRELAPSSSYARNMLISLEVARGNRPRAERLLDELLAEAETEGWLGDGLSLAAALLTVGDSWETALPLMQRAVSRYESYPEAHSNLATLCLRADRPEDALAPARQAVALDPSWLRAYMLLATVLVELDREDEALEVAARGARLPTAGPAFHLRHAMLLVSAGRTGEARELLDGLLRQDPLMVGALRQAGLLALREGRLEDARTYFRQMLRAGDQLSALYLLGRTEDLQGNVDAAAHFYRQVVSGENMVSAQVRVSDILARSGLLEESLHNLTRFSDLFPQHEIAFTEARARILANAGRGDEALIVFEEAISRWPDESGLRFGYAYLLEQLDRVDEALFVMEGLVRDYPDNPDALNALGYTLADRTDRHREARRYVQSALALAPDNPAIIDSMGWVEYRRGRYQRAISHLERAWSMLRDPEIAAHLGEVLWMAGRPDEAFAIWRDALSMFPNADALSDVMTRFAE
jgi:tetratricopeptide (TPR) repeat protein